VTGFPPRRNAGRKAGFIGRLPALTRLVLSKAIR